jgi:PAS domain S-box-containing protein
MPNKNTPSQGLRSTRPVGIICWALGCSSLIALKGPLLTLFSAAWSQAYNLIALTAVLTAICILAYRRKRNDFSDGPSSLVDERQEFADALPHVLWGTTADGRCEFLNDRYTDMFGIPRLQAIREQSWVDHIHPADRPKMYQAWRGAVENGSSSYSAHARVRMNDGSYRWMESSGRSVRSAKTGEVVKWFGSLNDVQKQVESEEAIARLQFDLQTIADEYEMLLGGAEQRLQMVFKPGEIGWIEYQIGQEAPASGALNDYTLANFREHLEKHPSAAHELTRTISISRASERTVAALGYADVSQLVSGRASIAGARGFDIEIAILTAIRNRTPTSCGIAEFLDADGNMRLYPFSLWITESGVARVALFDASEADQQSEMFGSARQHLAKANRIASATALSASLIHEISQPVTAISIDLATATRLATSGPTNSEALIRVLDRLRWNTQRLTEIGSRTRESLKPARHNREHVDLPEMVARCRKLLIDPLSDTEKVISIVIDGDLPLVLADPVALMQVVCALLQNALESVGSSDGATPVSVEISCPARSTDLRVKISDRGKGVDEEHLALLFDPFFSTKPNRLGFGLTVCQSVVESFGGTLRLYNRLDGGAVAEFSIPNEALQFREARPAV